MYIIFRHPTVFAIEREAAIFVRLLSFCQASPRTGNIVFCVSQLDKFYIFCFPWIFYTKILSSDCYRIDCYCYWHSARTDGLPWWIVYWHVYVHADIQAYYDQKMCFSWRDLQCNYSLRSTHMTVSLYSFRMITISSKNNMTLKTHVQKSMSVDFPSLLVFQQFAFSLQLKIGYMALSTKLVTFFFIN